MKLRLLQKLRLNNAKDRISGEEKPRRKGLVLQVAILFAAGLLVVGILGWFALLRVANMVVVEQKEELASAMAADLEQSVSEYPSWEYLFDYWYENRDSLDVEYDKEEDTLKKLKAFTKNNPDFMVTDASVDDIKELPESQRKTYAEIVYSWLILRMNGIISAYDAEYLSIVSVDPYYKERTYIISGSDGSKPRGTGKDDVYILGVTQECDRSQTEAMEKAVKNGYYIRRTSSSLSRYTLLDNVNNRHIMIIASFEMRDLMAEAVQSAVQFLFSYLFLILILALLCLALIYFLALRPLEKVRESVEEYAKTRKSEIVIHDLKGIKSENEIGELSDSFIEMVREIDSHIDEIKQISAENERIGAELSVATQIQADMLPRIFPAFPGRKDVDIYALMRPAKEVGGDFYDFFLIDDDHLCMVIADVSEKGVPAALFMVISKTIIKNRAMHGGTPGEILSDVNDQLCMNNEEGLFVTVWLAIVELSTGRGRAANAGHEHPALKRTGGSFELVEYKHSPMIAMRAGLKYADHEFQLYPGDAIFVYTDGVTEATDIDEELFGTERMLKALNSADYAELDLKKLLDRLLRSIDGFVGTAPQFDDITMLCFRYLGGADQDT